MKIGWIINSRIKKAKQLADDMRSIGKQFVDFQVDTVLTNQEERATALANQLAKNRYNVIIAVGGDGTLNEVVNGIAKAPEFTGILALFPAGTANDFSKTVGCPESIHAVYKAIEKGDSYELYTGLINFTDGSGQPQTRHFINIADLGLGAYVVQRVEKSSKRFGPDFTFFKAILQTFLSYKNKTVSIESANWKYQGHVNSIVIANAKYFGSGLCIAPDANPEKPLFEAIVIGDISILDYLSNLRAIKKGKIINHPEVHYYQSSSLEVTHTQEPCAIECDGEFVGFTPAKISVNEQKLRFLKA